MSTLLDEVRRESSPELFYRQPRSARQSKRHGLRMRKRRHKARRAAQRQFERWLDLVSELRDVTDVMFESNEMLSSLQWIEVPPLPEQFTEAKK